MLHEIDEFLTVTEGYLWIYFAVSFALAVVWVLYLRLRRGYPKYTWREDAQPIVGGAMASFGWPIVVLVVGLYLLAELFANLFSSKSDIRVIIPDGDNANSHGK